jgi:hypothetical protein
MASIAPYIQLPPTIRSSISAINDEGIYLLDDGFTFSLLIGKDVSLDVRAEILSIESNCCEIWRDVFKSPTPTMGYE